MIKKVFLHLLIEDFLISKRWKGGYGLLKDYPQAAKFSSETNDRQRRRYNKFEKVPRPFVRFLKDVGVRFTRSEDELSGIKVSELEAILIRSESDRPSCTICNESLKSLLKHLEYRSLIERNKEIEGTYTLVAVYHNDYGRMSRENEQSY